MILRHYQEAARAATWDYLRDEPGNPTIIVPPGGGKTPILAQMCKDVVETWGGRALVVSHVKELLAQAANNLRRTAPDLPVGIYSAGLGEKDFGRAVTVAGIQSVYQHADKLGPIDVVFVDEAHMIPPDGEGMYQQLFAGIKNVSPASRVIGLTATPYRMGTGMICGVGGDHLFAGISYEIGVRQLIAEGFLSPLVSRAGVITPSTDGIKLSGGEFVRQELERTWGSDDIIRAACADFTSLAADRRSVLVFCTGVSHARRVAAMVTEITGDECGLIVGDKKITSDMERERLIERFKAGSLKYLANVEVLTTGFDAPNVDCVVMLRATMSHVLYYQICGRGLRLSEGKRNCLVLDYAGNVLRHGPIDMITVSEPRRGTGEAVAKECPKCHALIASGYARCPGCGHAFPEREEKPAHSTFATGEAILSDDAKPVVTTLDVLDTSYHVHYKGGDRSLRPTMRVEYQCGLSEWHKEWVCIEHPDGTFPRTRAEQWWYAHSCLPFPQSVGEAVAIAEGGGVAETRSITIEDKPGDKFVRITDYDLGPLPEQADYCDDGLTIKGIPIDDIPF